MMSRFDVHGAGRAFMLFLLGLLTYLLAARGIQHPPCPAGITGCGTPCAGCPMQSGCVVGAEAR